MNSFGKLFKVSVYGESHGPSIGVLIDGVKPGIKLDYELIDEFLNKRRPNYLGSTPRKEKDIYTIESGVFNDVTTGTPLLVNIKNENIKSKDYKTIEDIYRPSHTDFVAKAKYKGYNNLPGSSHFSGRITAGLVVAGAIAKMHTNYEIESEIIKVGALNDLSEIDDYIAGIKDEKDSIGAVIRLKAKNVEAGLGEPFFGSADSVIAAIMYSVPAVKGVSFGTGFRGVVLKGSEFNDSYLDKDGKTKTNHAGGINGGITNGNEVVVNVFIKPASSIGKPQKTFNFKTNEMDTLEIEGRHDSFIAKRAMIVLESALHIALCDLKLLNIYNK